MRRVIASYFTAVAHTADPVFCGGSYCRPLGTQRGSRRLTALDCSGRKMLERNLASQRPLCRPDSIRRRVPIGVHAPIFAAVVDQAMRSR